MIKYCLFTTQEYLFDCSICTHVFMHILWVIDGIVGYSYRIQCLIKHDTCWKVILSSTKPIWEGL